MRAFMNFLQASVLFGTLCSAHMAMSDPPPIMHIQNPFAAGQVDYDYVNPLSPSGSDFPCKGYHQHLDSDLGQPVAGWTAGQSYSMTISGGAVHNGGSCQAFISHDGGQTFKVIHSYIGNCPSGAGDTSYQFTLPRDTPSAERALFAWTWFNNVGNREMYMNCAVVSVSGGGSGLGSRPNIFEANIGNGCSTAESFDVMFPNPGPDVSNQGTNTAPPTGSCETGPGAGQGTPERPESPGGPGAPGVPGASPDATTPPDAPEFDQGNGGDGAVPEAGNGYTPGNDWPDWFTGDASAIAVPMTPVAAVVVYVIVQLICYFLDRWL